MVLHDPFKSVISQDLPVHYCLWYVSEIKSNAGRCVTYKDKHITHLTLSKMFLTAIGQVVYCLCAHDIQPCQPLTHVCCTSQELAVPIIRFDLVWVFLIFMFLHLALCKCFVLNVVARFDTFSEKHNVA